MFLIYISPITSLNLIDDFNPMKTSEFLSEPISEIGPMANDKNWINEKQICSFEPKPPDNQIASYISKHEDNCHNNNRLNKKRFWNLTHKSI